MPRFGIACDWTAAIMCQILSDKISYTIERQNRGQYGVKAAACTGPQVLIAPFVTRREAQAWIDGSVEQHTRDGLDGHSFLP